MYSKHARPNMKNFRNWNHKIYLIGSKVPVFENPQKVLYSITYSTLLSRLYCTFTLLQWFSCFFHSVAMVFLLLHSVAMVFLLLSLCRNGFPASFTLSQWFSCFFHSVAMVFMLLSLCHNGFSCCLLYTTVYLNTNKCHIQSSAMHFVCIEVPAEWGLWLLSFLLIKKIW